jgi:thiamine biosynthesis lipoprotein
MCRDEFDAMGTCISVLLPVNRASPGFAVVRALFEEWEQTLSRFLADSELSYVNAHAGVHLCVSGLFLHVVETALEAARATDGIYDPTLLHQLVGAGYDRTFAQLPSSAPDNGYRASPGGAWRAVQVDHQRRTVWLPPETALDFGGIAKGMAVDAALDQLIAMGPGVGDGPGEPARSPKLPPDRGAGADHRAGPDHRGAVEAGGDLRVHGHPPNQDGWPVAVQVLDGHEIVVLRSGALATSSVSRRHWKKGGATRHHLLDPRSGEPVENGLWSVTVAASRCMQADVAAKTAFVLGPERGAGFLISNHLSALLVMTSGERRSIGFWPEQAAGDDRSQMFEL